MVRDAAPRPANLRYLQNYEHPLPKKTASVTSRCNKLDGVVSGVCRGSREDRVCEFERDAG
jgi:hypothetical protein